MRNQVVQSSYPSWGRFPVALPDRIQSVARNDLPHFSSAMGPYLAYGLGRSYGDSCLNEHGVLLDTSGLSRIIAFDPEAGSIRCESGVTLREITTHVLPHGWFLPVTPGTQFVTLGGAIANDVHGKNHHGSGTFGCHITSLSLVRSGGEIFTCSLCENEALFKATIGGLGLTGLIVEAELQLKRVTSSSIDVEHLPLRNLDNFFDLATESDSSFEYTVAWIDCLASKEKTGRGIFFRGEHSQSGEKPAQPGRSSRMQVPVDLPSWLLNRHSMRLFNAAYYAMQSRRKGVVQQHFEPFFYPLDSIRHWNRIYGKRGFLQYQFVVPPAESRDATTEVLRRIVRSGQASFLAVLKLFGSIESPGLMSFPRSGATLAVDFPNRGQSTLQLLDDLDDIVAEAGGAVYPAKDARMSAERFQQFFPQWSEFARFKDPAFSSSFWRRVTNQPHRNP